MKPQKKNLFLQKDYKNTYVAFLDDDDIWAESKVQRQIETFAGLDESYGAVTTLFCSFLDNRIISKQIQNSGVSVARNTGIDLASGKYIMFVDSDDVIHENLIISLVKMSENDNYDVSFHINHYKNIEHIKEVFTNKIKENKE